MVKVRKQPVEVEAVRYIGLDPGDGLSYMLKLANGGAFYLDPATFGTEPGAPMSPPNWLREAIAKGKAEGGLWAGHHAGETVLMVGTLESPRIAKPGDYIIQGVPGEFYPCKPDIFARTYELAE